MQSWGQFAGVVGAVSIEDVVVPDLAMNWPWFRFNRSHDRATIRPWSDHDRATIGRRSWCWCSIDRRLMKWEGSIVWFRAEGGWSLLDRGAIAVRSRFDRTAIVEFFHEPSKPSDREESPPPAVRSMKIAIAMRSVWWRSRSSWQIAMSSIRWRSRSVRWRSNLSEPSTFRPIRSMSSSLKLRLSTCCDFDRVDSGPRDRRLVIAFDDRDASASPATEKRVGHSPTRRKIPTLVSLKCGVW